MRLLTLKSVLVATDLGDSARYPLLAAGRLASLAGASVHLLHVPEGEGADDQKQLGARLRQLLPDSIRPDTLRITRGTAADVIVARAAEVKADVVVLGPHRGLAKDGSLGSTANLVVAKAPCPCLVAATELRLPLERVLVPIDGSRVTEVALSVAVTWSSALRRRGAQTEVVAMHVTNEATESGNEAALTEEVERVRSNAGDAAFVAIRQLTIPDANVAEQILEQATSQSADLLVLGTDGAGSSPAVLGRVSAAVARDTTCPLLLVSSRMHHVSPI